MENNPIMAPAAQVAEFDQAVTETIWRLKALREQVGDQFFALHMAQIDAAWRWQTQAHPDMYARLWGTLARLGWLMFHRDEAEREASDG